MADNLEHEMTAIKESITAACGQMKPVFGDAAANLKRIEEMTLTAGADLIVFPELCTSGYEMRDRGEALELSFSVQSSLEIRRLKQLAGDSGSHIVLGFPERSGAKVYNGCALVEPEGAVTRYRKLHLFDREKSLFDPGDAVPPVKQTAVGRIGLMICFDWVFPETARLIGLAGGQILCHPSNLVLTYCQRAMFARSVENGIFSLTCNRIGSEERTDRRLSFTGQSQILSHRGAILAQASAEGEELIKAELKPADADNKFLTKLNDVFKDRRPEFYRGLCPKDAKEDPSLRSG